MTNLTVEQLVELRDHLKAAAEIGAKAIPGTYFTGVDMAIRWAERNIARAEGKTATPVLDSIRKQVGGAA